MLSKPLAAALALAAGVAAHGHVDHAIINGVKYQGYDSPAFHYMPVSMMSFPHLTISSCSTNFNGQNPPNVFGWTIEQTDNGFVEPNAAGSANIICHRDAVPAKSHVELAAGDTIFLQWDTWPESHQGPVVDYLANCNGPCENVNKNDLEFFKIGNAGLMEPSNAQSYNGYWAADQLIDSGFAWSVKIPSNVAPGNYVLRHEIIALHSGSQPNGAQFYPQCFNLKITGSGTAKPAGVRGTSLYRANDPGVLFNIFTAVQNYPIPGPTLAAGGVSWVPQTRTSATATASATPSGSSGGGGGISSTSNAPQPTTTSGGGSGGGGGGNVSSAFLQNRPCAS